MSSVVEQELAVRASIPTAVPGGTIPAAGTILIKDSSSTMLTYIPGPSPVINIYAPANWPVAIADHPIFFLDSDSGNLMIRMPTNSPFNGVVAEVNTSLPL